MFGGIFYALLLGVSISFDTHFATATVAENGCNAIEPYKCDNLDPYKDLVILWHHENSYQKNLKYCIQTLYIQSLGVERMDDNTPREGLAIAIKCIQSDTDPDTYLKCYERLVKKVSDNLVYLPVVEHYRIAFLLRILFSCRLLKERVRIYSSSYYGRIPENILRWNGNKCERLNENLRKREIEDISSKVPDGKYSTLTPENGRQLRWIIAHKMTSASRPCALMESELKLYIPNPSKDLPYVWAAGSIENNIRRLYLDFVGYTTFNLVNYESSELYEYLHSGNKDASDIQSRMFELISKANELNNEERDRFHILIGITVGAGYEKLDHRVKAYLKLVLERIDVSNVKIRQTGSQGRECGSFRDDWAILVAGNITSWLFPECSSNDIEKEILRVQMKIDDLRANPCKHDWSTILRDIETSAFKPHPKNDLLILEEHKDPENSIRLLYIQEVGLQHANANEYKQTTVYRYLISKKSRFEASEVESKLLNDFHGIVLTPEKRARIKVIVDLLFNHLGWENCFRAYLMIVYGQMRIDGVKGRISAEQPCLTLSRYWFISEIDETFRLYEGLDHAIQQINQVRQKILCLKIHHCDKTSKCGFLRAPTMAMATEIFMSRQHFASATTSIKKITVTKQRPAQGLLKRLQSFVLRSENKPLTAVASLKRIDTNPTRKTTMAKKVDHANEKKSETKP